MVDVNRLWGEWAKHLLHDSKERLAFQAGLYASEGWVASECAWALRHLDVEMLVERHLEGMGKGLRADLAVLPVGGTDKDATVFELKAAWCESTKTIGEAVRGVENDLQTRTGHPDVYSLIFGFSFEWADGKAPRRFRWQPERGNTSSFGDVLRELDAELEKLKLTKVHGQSVTVEGSPSAHLHLSLWRHPTTP